MRFDVRAEISATGKLSDKDQRCVRLIEKSLSVSEHIGVVDAGEDSDLIEAICDISGTPVAKLNFLERVESPVLFSLGLVDRGIAALTQLAQNLEILHAVNKNYIL